jgi:hypothetical protein
MRPLYTWAPHHEGRARLGGGANVPPREHSIMWGSSLGGGRARSRPAWPRDAHVCAPPRVHTLGRARMRPSMCARGGAHTTQFFHFFSSKFLNINLVGPNSRTYTFYVIHCKKILQIVGHTHFEIPLDLFQFCVVLHFHLVLLLFKWMKLVLTVPIERNMIFTIFLILINLPLY